MRSRWSDTVDESRTQRNDWCTAQRNLICETVWSSNVAPTVLAVATVVSSLAAGSVARLRSIRDSRRPPQLDVHDLLNEARRTTLLEDFGRGEFRAGFDLLVDATNERGLSGAATRSVRALLVASLRSRLVVRDWMKKNPQARHEVISSPLFVVGLPGSGTRLVGELLSADPLARVPTLHESFAAGLPGGVIGRPGELDPRVGEADRLLATVRAGLPEIALGRGPTAAAGAELLAIGSFVGSWWADQLGVTAHADWSASADPTPVWEFQRLQLQALQAAMSTRQWVLTGRWPLEHLASVWDQYPAADVVWLHRDPSALDTTTRVRQALDGAGAVDQAMPGRIMHVPTAELVDDPVGAIERVYHQLGRSLPELGRWRMDALVHGGRVTRPQIGAASTTNATAAAPEPAWATAYRKRFSVPIG